MKTLIVLAVVSLSVWTSVQQVCGPLLRAQRRIAGGVAVVQVIQVKRFLWEELATNVSGEGLPAYSGADAETRRTMLAEECERMGVNTDALALVDDPGDFDEEPALR